MHKSKWLTFVVVFVLLVAQLAVLEFVPTVKAIGANWLTGYSYRRSHVLVHATGADTNYQKRIVVKNGTSEGASTTFETNDTITINNKIRSDFGDVNWTNSDGSTCLKYWMETLNTGKNATFWIKESANLTSTDQTVYMYYGKTGQTTLSSGTNTFLFFEDFNSYSNGNLTGQGGWSGDAIFQVESSTVYEGAKAVGVSGGTAASRYIRKALSSGMPNSLEVIVRLRAGQTNLHTCYVGPEAGSGNNIVNTHAGADGIWYSNGATSGADGAYAKDIWYRIQLCIRLSNQGGKIYGTSWSAYNTPEYTGQPTYICLKTYSANAVGYYDLVILKKFVDPEPTHGSWGSQETSGQAYTVDSPLTVTTTLSSTPKLDFKLIITQPVTSAFASVLNWNALLNLQNTPSITLTQASKTDFILTISQASSPSFTSTSTWNAVLNPQFQPSISISKTIKSDFSLTINSASTMTFTSLPKTDFIITVQSSVTPSFAETEKTDYTLNPANPITATFTSTPKTDFTLTVQNPTSPSLTLLPQWNATVNPQLQPSVTFEKISQTNFLITINNPVTTNWLLDIIQTSVATYTVDLAASITASFETVKQWFANIIITAEPSVTLTQVTKSDFIISFNSSMTTGWTLNALIPSAAPPLPEAPSWFPAKITLFTQVYNVLAGVWQFTWTQEVPVSVNVTIKNESPYTSGTLHYQIINLDTNKTVVDWTVGEAVLIDAEGNTTLVIQDNVPIRRDFTAEHFRVNVKLSLIQQVIETSADFEVQKDMVRTFYSNVALLSLCMALVGVALYSYKQKEEPWKKYPIEFKKKKYPERKGKK